MAELQKIRTQRALAVKQLAAEAAAAEAAADEPERSEMWISRRQQALVLSSAVRRMLAGAQYVCRDGRWEADRERRSAAGLLGASARRSLARGHQGLRRTAGQIVVRFLQHVTCRSQWQAMRSAGKGGHLYLYTHVRLYTYKYMQRTNATSGSPQDHLEATPRLSRGRLVRVRTHTRTCTRLFRPRGNLAATSRTPSRHLEAASWPPRGYFDFTSRSVCVCAHAHAHTFSHTRTRKQLFRPRGGLEASRLPLGDLEAASCVVCGHACSLEAVWRLRDFASRPPRARLEVV